MRKDRGMAQENQEASTGQEALGGPSETGRGAGLPTRDKGVPEDVAGEHCIPTEQLTLSNRGD